MAKTLGLAMKVFADAGGVAEKLSPVEKALKQLDAECVKVTDVFKKFGTESGTAAAMQEKFEVRVQALNESLRAGLTSPQDYARSLEQLQAAANAAASDLDAAARVVEANLTREQRAQQEYQNSIAELNRLRGLGLLSEQEYGDALRRVSGDYAKATLAADKYADAANKSGDAGTLKFNELSGVLSALPGPLGNVAGRLSGLSSAGEGLARVFSGGLTQGISSIGTSVVGLINPFTAAVAGIAAFGAGAVAVTRGLIDLEDRVEKLGNTADKLGVSFEFIQTLEAAAARSGTSIESVSAAFGRLQKNVTGVDEESKAAQAALSSIGVTAEQLQALKPEDQYRLIGERLQAIEDPAKRTAASIQLFGKSGADLLPFFKNLGGAASDMERFGRALTDLDRKRIDDFGAGLDALQVATQGLGQTLLLPFAGLGEGIATAFAEIISGVTAIVDPIGQVLEPVLTQIGRVVEVLGVGLGNFGKIIGAVFEPFAVLVQGVAQALEPLYDGFVEFYRVFSDSQVVVAEWFMSFTPIGVIADNIGVISDTLGRVVTIITTGVSKAVEYVSGLAAGFGELVSNVPILESLGNVVSSVFSAISESISNLVSGVGDFINDLLTIAESFLGIDRGASQAAEATAAVVTQTQELSQEEQKIRDDREKTFQRLREEVNNAIDDSRKFGDAGREAALRYDASVEQLKKSLSSGLIDEEQFRRSVRIAGQVFDEELKKIEDRKQIEIKVKEDAQKAIEKVSESIDKATIKAEDLGASGTRALAQFSDRATALRNQFAAGLIDENQLAKGVEAANRQYEKQLEQIKQANAERQKQIEADQKRSEALLDEMDKTRAIQRDREVAEREVARIRAEWQRQGYLTPEQRQQLLELQQLQVDLAEKQKATAQGFEDGYAKAFDATNKKFRELTEKSQEFGAAGAEAARRLSEGLAAAAQQAQAGGTAEQYDLEVRRQQQLYENELKNLKAVADERLKTNQMVDELLLLQSVGGDSQRAEAKKKLIAIEEEMLRIQQEITAARQAGDSEAIRNGAQRLSQLDQAAAYERDIASGQAKLQQDYIKRSEEQQKTALQSQQAYAQQQQAIFAEQQKAADAEAKRQEERIRGLNTLGPQSLSVQDVRTQAGASLVIQAATNAQDPAAIQQRLQTKYLEQIAAGIAQASKNYFNAPVAIVGYGSLGDVRA